MVEQPRACYSSREVRRVGQRRELVTHIGARDDHAGSESRINAKACADGHECDADGGRGRPRRAARPTDDGADDAANGQERLRREQRKAVVDKRRNGAANHKRADEQAYEQQDENRFHRNEKPLDDAFEHVLERAPVSDAHDACHHDRAEQRQVCGVVCFGVCHPAEHVNHERCHAQDGHERPEHIGQTYLARFLGGGFLGLRLFVRRFLDLRLLVLSFVLRLVFWGAHVLSVLY